MENIFSENIILEKKVNSHYKTILSHIEHIMTTLNEAEFINRVAKSIYSLTSINGVRIMTPSYVKIVGKSKGISYSLNSDNMTLTIYYFSISKKEQEDIELIFEIARIHLKNILEHNRIIRSTFFDNLTGAYTRQVGIEIIEKIFESIKRRQRKGYLVFIDIDDLKKYNDKYGHQKGDELLKNIAHAILSNIRKNDILLRYGGDEFLLYIDSTSPENVLKRIAEVSEVKFSYGIVNLEEFTTLQEAIQSADMKMYEFKNSSKSAISYYTNAKIL